MQLREHEVTLQISSALTPRVKVTNNGSLVDIHSLDCVHDGPYVSAAPSTRRVLDLATSVIHKEGKAS